jgi:hypothetical protein
MGNAIHPLRQPLYYVLTLGSVTFVLAIAIGIL